VPDNAQLFSLDEANLLHNVSRRYEADEIYTYTGTVLLALNPYQALPKLYDEETMNSYRGRALGVIPPPVYGIAERARRLRSVESWMMHILFLGYAVSLGFLARHPSILRASRRLPLWSSS
jgi:myosin V